MGSFGRLQALENQNERSAQLLYGPVGRLLTETGFDGRLTCYQYDIAMKSGWSSFTRSARSRSLIQRSVGMNESRLR